MADLWASAGPLQCGAAAQYLDAWPPMATDRRKWRPKTSKRHQRPEKTLALRMPCDLMFWAMRTPLERPILTAVPTPPLTLNNTHSDCPAIADDTRMRWPLRAEVAFVRAALACVLEPTPDNTSAAQAISVRKLRRSTLRSRRSREAIASINKTCLDDFGACFAELPTAMRCRALARAEDDPQLNSFLMTLVREAVDAYFDLASTNGRSEKHVALAVQSQTRETPRKNPPQPHHKEVPC